MNKAQLFFWCSGAALFLITLGFCWTICGHLWLSLIGALIISVIYYFVDVSLNKIKELE